MQATRATSERGRAVRAVLGALLGALLAALVVALATLLGTEAHQMAYSVGGVRLPVGLAMALVLTALVTGLLRLLGVSLLVRASAALGWLAVTAAVLHSGPGEDVLVPANVRGYGWLLGGFAVLMLVLLLPDRDRRRARG